MLPLWLRLEREYHARVCRWELPLNTATVLLKLHLQPDLTEPAALADASCLPRQTMTYVLDWLEARRLASRAPHPRDRRRKLIRLSAKGRTLAAAIYRDLITLESRALRSLGDTAAPILQHLVARFTDAMAAENRRKRAPGAPLKRRP
jgi:DNA-binding MarR family transcriptional regulator